MVSTNYVEIDVLVDLTLTPAAATAIRKQSGTRVALLKTITCYKLLSSSYPHPETLFWHSFWHTIWKYIWHKTFYLTVFLAYTLTFFLTLSGIFWHSILHLFRHPFWHSFGLSDVLSGISLRPGSADEIWSSRLTSSSPHWDLELAVEVRQCPLRSGTRSWDPRLAYHRYSPIVFGWAPASPKYALNHPMYWRNPHLASVASTDSDIFLVQSVGSQAKEAKKWLWPEIDSLPCGHNKSGRGHGIINLEPCLQDWDWISPVRRVFCSF